MIELDIRWKSRDFDLQVAFESRARHAALFGPSGSGKTSGLLAIAGLRRPDAGRIRLDGDLLFDSTRGVHVAPARRGLGVVFQDGRLFHTCASEIIYFMDNAANQAATLQPASTVRSHCSASGGCWSAAGDAVRRRGATRRHRPGIAEPAARAAARRAARRPAPRSARPGAAVPAPPARRNPACPRCWSATSRTKCTHWPRKSCCSMTAASRSSGRSASSVAEGDERVNRSEE